jgi:hypothetical protein
MLTNIKIAHKNNNFMQFRSQSPFQDFSRRLFFGAKVWSAANAPSRRGTWFDSRAQTIILHVKTFPTVEAIVLR